MPWILFVLFNWCGRTSVGGTRTLGIRITGKSIWVAALLIATFVRAGTATADLEPQNWINEAEAAYSSVTSYTAVFHKQQRVAGELLPEETILLKFRKPSSLYMRWIKEPYAGSELLYVEGWNQNRVRARRGGLLGFITRNLDPRDPKLMKDNLRPVTDIGIGFLIKTIAADLREAITPKEVVLAQLGEETVYGRNTQVFEIVFLRMQVTRYAGPRLIVNQDVENKIPIKLRVYDWADQLVENYGYERLDLGTQLTAADFDPKNPDYHF
jgi:uncharacterized protein DUF1571